MLRIRHNYSYYVVYLEGDAIIVQQIDMEEVEMPTHVEKKGSKYAIVENATGKVKGTSKTKKDAEISSSIRNQAVKKKEKK